MNNAEITIEQAVEAAIAVAVQANIDLLKAKNPALSGTIIDGLFLENPDKGGASGKRRDVGGRGPRVSITCKPSIPKGYRSNAHTCMVNISSTSAPDSDPDHLLAVLLYRAYRKVLDNGEISLPPNLMELRGYVITDSDAGIKETGYEVSVGIRMEVFVKPVGEKS